METADYLAVLSDRSVMLLAGLLAGLILLGPLSLYRALGLEVPYRLLVRAITKTQNKLNRTKRSSATLVYRGIVIMLFFTGVAGLIGYGVHTLNQFSPYIFFVEVALIAYLIPTRHLLDRVSEVGRYIKANQLPQAKGCVSALARREVGALDAPGMLRVSVEYLAENLCDKIIAPALFYLAFGLAGLCACRMLNLLDHLLGHRAKETMAFGWASARMDDVMLLIPARFTGLLIVFASLFVPKGKPLGAVATLARDRSATASPNAGWPLAATAGALGVSLGGARKQQGALIDDAWIGKGSAKLNISDFRRAQWLYVVSLLLLLLAGLALLAFLSGGDVFSIDAVARLRSFGYIS